MRISDWSSDVCSSDLPILGGYGINNILYLPALNMIGFYEHSGYFVYLSDSVLNNPSVYIPYSRNGQLSFNPKEGYLSSNSPNTVSFILPVLSNSLVQEISYTKSGQDFFLTNTQNIIGSIPNIDET